MNRVNQSESPYESAQLKTLDVAYRDAVTDGRDETVRLLVGRGYAAAVVIAIGQAKGSLAVALLEDYTANAALDVISNTVARIKDGTLAPASIGSLTAYLIGATRKAVGSPSRVRVPRRLVEFGYPGRLLFKLVVDHGMDPNLAVAQVEQDFPLLAEVIRTTYLPEVLSYLTPGRKPAAVVRRDAEATVSLDDLNSHGSDMPDPLETTLRTLVKEKVREAVASLPEPDRTYATAYYLDKTCQTHADLAAQYKLGDRDAGKYAMRKVRDKLRARLENLLS